MEWIRRNPKKAAGLSALALACVVILVWGVTNGSGKADPTLGVTAPLATPTQAPPRSLTGPLAPSAAPTSVDQVVGGLPSTGMGGISGVGATKLARYGASILEIIRAVQAEASAA